MVQFDAQSQLTSHAYGKHCSSTETPKIYPCYTRSIRSDNLGPRKRISITRLPRKPKNTKQIPCHLLPSPRALAWYHKRWKTGNRMLLVSRVLDEYWPDVVELKGTQIDNTKPANLTFVRLSSRIHARFHDAENDIVWIQMIMLRAVIRGAVRSMFKSLSEAEWALINGLETQCLPKLRDESCSERRLRYFTNKPRKYSSRIYLCRRHLQLQRPRY